jgi:DNA-binding beta-propeller fold protein YncE
MKKNLLYALLTGLLLLILAALPLLVAAPAPDGPAAAAVKRYLYVATPGIRNYLEYGGHGLLVYDIDNNYRLVKRIPTAGLDDKGQPSNVKGVAVSLATNCIYITTLTALQCLDLTTEKLLWEKKYEGGCDRLAISPDGKTIYLPSLEKEHWHIVDAKTGDVIKKLETNSGAHNTLYGPDNRYAYLAGLRTTTLGVADTRTHTVQKQVGPFSAPVRPFTINGRQTLCFVNVNDLLGFEVGDLVTGQKLHRVVVQGFEKGPVKRHGCPSHGIGLTPDEKELWVADAYNQRLHIFDATQLPPRQLHSVEVRDQPGWITFSRDGRHAFPSTGEIIDVKTRQSLTTLKDEQGQPVQSEKMVEIHFKGRKAVAAGDQFGIGRVVR